MQFPVPQFTEVEDKIIGPLTIKQFGILFGVGIVVFLGYSLTKSLLVLIFFAILFGLPGLGVAFAPFNGRPMYNNIGNLFKFITSTKILIFHKEAHSISSVAKLKDAELSTAEKPSDKPVQTSQDNLKKIEELLNATASQEKDIAGKLR